MGNYRSTSSKQPKRAGSLSSFAEVLPGLCQDLELDKKVNEMALMALWPRQVEVLMGKALAQHTKAIKLRKQGYQTILMVKVANAVMASELSFQIPALKDALNGFSPQTGLTVDQIQLLVGSL